MSNPRPLTARALRFVAELAKDPNREGRAAAIAAGYSPRGAEVTACRLLKRPEIRSEVDKIIEKASMRSLLSVERVQEEIARLAFSDPGRIVGADGRLLPIHELPEDVRRAIASVKCERDENGNTTWEYRFWDKPKSHELAGKHLGMFREQTELHVGVGILVVHL